MSDELHPSGVYRRRPVTPAPPAPAQPRPFPSPAARPLCPRETARAPFMPYGALLFTSARRFQRGLLPSRPAKLPRRTTGRKRLGSASRPPRAPSLAQALLCARPQTGRAEEGSNPGPGPQGACPTGQPARKHLARPRLSAPAKPAGPPAPRRSGSCAETPFPR